MRSFLLLTACSLSLALAQEPPARLELVKTVECAALFGPGTYETSGIVLADGQLHVVFDNLAQVGSVGADLDVSSGALSVGRAGFSDYEAITVNPETGTYYVAIEAEDVGLPKRRARILELSADGERLNSWPVERELEGKNKGVEGLTTLVRGGKRYLLALLEGNHGDSGRRGREVGNGIVLVLERSADGWELAQELQLPPTANFVDYAGIDVRGDRVAVISQSSSALWVGELADDWTFADGETVAFPRQADGSLKYGRIEGVSWLSDTRLAMCSDQERPSDRGLGRVEQGIHVFDLVRDAPAANTQPVSASRGLNDRVGGN